MHRHSDSPLSETFARVNARAPVGDDDLSEYSALIGVPAGRDWISVAELGTRAELMERLLEAGVSAVARRDIAATWVSDVLVRSVAGPSVAALLLDARVPRLEPRAVWLRYPDGAYAAERVAFANARARALSSDARIDHPDLEPVADEDELLETLRGDLAALLAEPIEALAGASGRPRSALWRGAGDELAGAFLWAGEALEVRERAWRLGERCLAMGPPFDVKAGYRVLEHAGRTSVTRTQASCCLAYRAGHPLCFVCPLLSDDDRKAQMESWPLDEASA